MTLDEAFEGHPVSRDEVRRELGRHGFTLAEFTHDVGDRQVYDSAAVLEWLGY